LNAISQKALAAAKTAHLPRSYWDWAPMLRDNSAGFFPYTPSTNLLYGLKEALAMLLEEGFEKVVARNARHGEATRRAVQAWGLETVCQEPLEHSNVLTGVMMPAGHDADHLRKVVLERYDLMLAGTLSGVEMGLADAGVPFRRGGLMAAVDFLTEK